MRMMMMIMMTKIKMNMMTLWRLPLRRLLNVVNRMDASGPASGFAQGPASGFQFNSSASAVAPCTTTVESVLFPLTLDSVNPLRCRHCCRH